MVNLLCSPPDRRTPCGDTSTLIHLPTLKESCHQFKGSVLRFSNEAHGPPERALTERSVLRQSPAELRQFYRGAPPVQTTKGHVTSSETGCTCDLSISMVNKHIFSTFTNETPGPYEYTSVCFNLFKKGRSDLFCSATSASVFSQKLF